MASYIEQSLAPGEQIVARFQLHWLAWLRCWLSLVAGGLIAGFLAWFAASQAAANRGIIGWAVVAVVLVTLVAVAWQWLHLHTIEQGVTNHRVIRKTGIVARQSTELRLASIETVDLHQPFWGRILGYADVLITGRGEASMLLQRLAHPITVKRDIEAAYSQHVEGVRVGAPT